MRRSELDPADLAELAALDRILAGDAVDASELELAALVESVRADAPRLDDDAAARLDDRLAKPASTAPGAPRRRRRQRVGRIRPKTVARLVVAGLGVAAVAGTVALVITTAGPNSTVTEEGLPAHAASPVQVAPAGGAASAGPGVVVPAPAPAPAAPALAAPPTFGPSRLQQRSATVTLGTGSGSIGQVADEIVAATEQLGGVVQNSNVTEAGNGSLATFSLTVPSGSLAQLVTTLSRLARVESLNQSTQDITDAYGRATSRLAADRAERDALFVALARATTPNETASLHDRIAALDGRIASEQRAVASLRARARTATVAVVLQSVAPAPAAHRAGGTLRTGLHDAADVLQVSLAVALVALAVLAPLALVALAAWWTARVLRRRARERALQSS